MELLINLSIPFAGGLLLGLIFFGGLWLTVTRATHLRYAGVWFTGSLLLRIAAVAAGFYWLGGDQAERFGACLLGFILIKMLSTRMIGAARAVSANETETT